MKRCLACYALTAYTYCTYCTFLQIWHVSSKMVQMWGLFTTLESVMSIFIKYVPWNDKRRQCKKQTLYSWIETTLFWLHNTYNICNFLLSIFWKTAKFVFNFECLWLLSHKWALSLIIIILYVICIPCKWYSLTLIFGFANQIS